MRLFQVQTVHSDEIKEPIHGPLFSKIEALYLKTYKVQFRKHMERVLSFNLIYMINFSDLDINDFMNVSVQKIKNQREVLFVLEMLSYTI